FRKQAHRKVFWTHANYLVGFLQRVNDLKLFAHCRWRPALSSSSAGSSALAPLSANLHRSRRSYNAPPFMIDEMRRSIPKHATLSVIRRIHSVQLEIRRSTLEKGLLSEKYAISVQPAKAAGRSNDRWPR